jgi:uncharacterized protein (DUF1778 family)
MFGMIPLPVKLLFIAFLIAGAAGWGYMKGSAHAEIELANYQAKAEKQIADLTTKNANISEKVVTQFVDKVKVVHDQNVVYRDKLVTLGEGQNQLSTGWIELHDAAAKLANPDAQLASDKSPSGVMDNSALAVVISNYAICHENKEQLSALQQWITENQAAVDKVNEGKKK